MNNSNFFQKDYSQVRQNNVVVIGKEELDGKDPEVDVLIDPDVLIKENREVARQNSLKYRKFMEGINILSFV